MPVTRPLLSCSPFLSFQSAFRASGQSCAQCPWFLHNLHFVQVEKSCSLLAHSPHFHFLDTLFFFQFCFAGGALVLDNSQLHLSLPLRFRGAACAASRATCSASRAARACSFSVSRCSCLCVLLRLSWRRTVEVGVEFQCIQLSHWVDVCFVLWRCRPHRIFMWGNTNIL